MPQHFQAVYPVWWRPWCSASGNFLIAYSTLRRNSLSCQLQVNAIRSDSNMTIPRHNTVANNNNITPNKQHSNYNNKHKLMEIRRLGEVSNGGYCQRKWQHFNWIFWIICWAFNDERSEVLIGGNLSLPSLCAKKIIYFFIFKYLLKR